MKLGRIQHRDQVLWVDLSGAEPKALTQQQVRAILRGEALVDTRAVDASVPCALDRSTYPPLLDSATVYCIGLNYKAHVEEASRGTPKSPSVFIRSAASIVGHGQQLSRPTVSSQYDYEGEVAVVIGRPGRGIAEADAWAHVGGFTCFNDGSVRDFQLHSVTAGKNFESSGACGPWIVTIDAVSGFADLPLITRLNGTVVQQSSTANLIHSVPGLINYLSTITTLQTGDLIATGTPAGVGCLRTPPLWMQPGDTVEVEVAGVGVLANIVAQAQVPAPTDGNP